MTVATGRKYLASLGIVSVVAVCASACSGSSGSGGSSPSTTTSAASSPTASASPTSDQAAVLTTWHGYVATLTEMYNQANPSLSAWNDYAALTAASQATETVASFRANREIVPGAPKASDVTVTSIDTATNPPSATLTACWDTRGFQPVYAKTGKSAAPSGESPAPPHIADASLQRFSYGWRVVTFTISTQPC